jgi:hypothetical protein
MGVEIKGRQEANGHRAKRQPAPICAPPFRRISAWRQSALLETRRSGPGQLSRPTKFGNCFSEFSWWHRRYSIDSIGKSQFHGLQCRTVNAIVCNRSRKWLTLHILRFPSILERVGSGDQRKVTNPEYADISWRVR